MKQLLFLSLFFFTIQSDCQTVSYKTVKVEGHLSHQNYEHFKRLVLKSDDGNVEYIDGFDFDWGYNYELKLKVTKLKSELSDGTRFDFALEKVISKTKLPDSTEFRMHLDPMIYYYQPEDKGSSKALKLQDDGSYSYLGKVNIEVPDNLVEAFQKIVEGQTGRSAYFVYVNEKRIRLVRF